MQRLPKLHLAIGLLGLAAFLLSGQYMHHFLGHLKQLPDGPRMLYRTSHIYLMWASMLNLLLGTYLQPITHRSPARNIQLLGSVVILLAPVLLGLSFAIESGGATLARPICRVGIYFGLAGPVLHLLAQQIGKRSALTVA